jgi:peptidoglycan/LPS O-acetylase OafA/YrhL
MGRLDVACGTKGGRGSLGRSSTMLRPKPSPPPLPGSAAPRLAEVEGLRAVAACSILVFHCWLFSSPAALRWNLGPVTPFVQPLQSGVTLFFVLSGFLLYRPIISAVLEGRDLPSAGSYVRNRALRILPAYWVILVIVVLVLRSATVHAAGQPITTGAVHDPGTLAADLSLTQTYDPRTIWTGILPAWSLTIELAFYLLLPLLALAARFTARLYPSDRGKVVAVLTPVAGLLVAGAAGKAFVAAYSAGPERAVGADWHTVLDRSFLTHADLFAFGMAAAVALVLSEQRVQVIPTALSRCVGRPLAYTGIPTLILGFYLLPPFVYDSTVALLASLLLVRVLGPKASPRRRGSLLTHPWTLAWGRISYSVFLWNYPVLVFLGAHHVLASGNDAQSFVVNLAIAVPAVGILSYLTYRFVEAPALALKAHRPKRLHQAIPAPTTPR